MLAYRKSILCALLVIYNLLGTLYGTLQVLLKMGDRGLRKRRKYKGCVDRLGSVVLEMVPNFGKFYLSRVKFCET